MSGSPSFLCQKSNVVQTETRRNYLRNFINPSTCKNSSRIDDSEAPGLSTYYAQSTRTQKKVPFRNTARPTYHNTPLNTRKTKIYEMNQK